MQSTRSLRLELHLPALDIRFYLRFVGLYHREIDRGEFKIVLDGGKIGSIEVINGGDRYINPKAIIVDRTNNGKCASVQVNVQCGAITGMSVLNPGEDYVDPVVIMVETGGTYIPTTKDIGKIEAMKILKPGRAISADRSLKPEILIETKFVLDFDDQSVESFVEDQIVYQRH